ncbi:MAG TPA: short-chain dehydrogenase [Spongiibacteraceae bacterium]|nr:short-chain dehydrogenase [Spongiibacteraceae bacterium]HCS28509.1 short-chain dehydrogenase [Spongiibacteraceae bacterium]
MTGNPVFDFRQATVLVTGGSNGIGEGIARAFLAAGATVHITGRAASAADYDKDLSGLHYHSLEVSDNAAIDALATTIPALDILINNAGASLPGGRNEYEPDVFEEAIRINLTSAYRLAHAFLPQLSASEFPGGASIIGLASMSSLFGIEIVPAYGSAKTGLVGMTKALAVAWAKHGIRANAIAAGLIESNMTSAMMGIEEMTAPMLARTPLQRFGVPEDIANPILFLCSPAASYITGQTLAVDGGFSVQG